MKQLTVKSKRTNVNIRRPLLMVVALLVVILIGMIIRHHLLAPEPVAVTRDRPLTADRRVTGAIGVLTIPDWDIKLQFKDADKITYRLTDSRNSYLELYLKDTYMPQDDCGRIGISLKRTDTKPEGKSTLVDGYYYRIAGAPGFCGSDNYGSDATYNLKANLVSEVGRNIEVTAL